MNWFRNGLACVWISAIGIAYCWPWYEVDLISNSLNSVQHDSFTDQPASARLVQEPSEYTSFRLDYTTPSQSPNQRTHASVLKTFEQVVGTASKATVQVMSGNEQLAFGIVIESDGWVLTKASELIDDDLQCRFSDGSVVKAKQKSVRHDIDLALLKLETNNLPTIDWHEENLVKVGGWLATLSNRKTPVSVGVVSVPPRMIRAERAILGIDLANDLQGVLIKMVLPGGGAARAGIEKGDIIVAIDESKLKSQEAVISKINNLRAGQYVRVSLIRDNKAIEIIAQLMDLHPSLLEETEQEVNGSLSARSTGFEKVFQHDTVLEPNQCGGPLLDTRGRVVGVNIARAGRVNSYALPMDVVVPAVRSMLAAAKSVTVSESVQANGR